MNARDRCAGPALRTTLLALAAVTMAAAVGTVVAADSPAGASMASMTRMAPTKAMREQLAVLHEQMAACLRTDKPIAQCHQDMMLACKAIAPQMPCGMGGQGMPGKGMGMGMGMGSGMGRGMAAPPAGPPPTTAPAQGSGN